MKRRSLLLVCCATAALAVAVGLGSMSRAAAPGELPGLEVEPGGVPTIDDVLAAENRERGVTIEPVATVDDFAFLRRVTVDLIGRIPTEPEIQEYLAWPAAERRERVVDKLMRDPRFNDRWTVFYADLLRLRSNAEGGPALIAYVHQAIESDMPYDELARRLISAGGKSGTVPEVGYILGDNADPMALAGITSQIFMGVRISCAQCHDHPFDRWTQKDFYGFAAFFGQTRRQERRIGDRILGVYTTEVEQSSVLWPPEGAAEGGERKPMKPTFPIELAEADGPYRPIARLEQLRSGQDEKEQPAKLAGPSVDDLLAGAAKKADAATRGGSFEGLDVVDEAKRDVRSIDLKTAAYRNSDLRTRLAELVTDPRNSYFSRSFVNRMWKELIGRGFVEPVDDLSDNNPPSHPKTLAFLADEFVARGYDLRSLVKMIVLSDAYARAHAFDRGEAERQELEANFLATPMRRMLSEVLYDSIITAGHVFEPKHKAGQNLKVVWQQGRRIKPTEGEPERVDLARVEAQPLAASGQMPRMAKDDPKKPAAGYDLEKAIELDFDAILANAKQEDSVKVDQMMVKSAEEIEAERMQREMRQRQAEYIDVFTKAVIDDNPQFGSALRMQTPAPEGHFLRVFGQPARQELGDERDPAPTMRQALMILNGRLTNEAARVGELEPIYPLLVGKTADVEKAIQLAYREILTRDPDSQEVADAREIVTGAASPTAGMADLRWVLLNCHEFRFLP